MIHEKSHKVKPPYSYEVIFMAIKSVSIRIEEEMLEKLSYVADYEGRSVNSHILVLIRQSIHSFEEKNGAIEGEIQAALNVKPARRQRKE